MKKETAEEYLTLKPDIEYTLPEDKFIGRLYKPDTDLFHHKAIIMIGGSDGSFALTCLIAEQFVKRGLTVLAAAYWNQPGLPLSLAGVPIETIELAARKLKNVGYDKVGIWGISMGAEMALLAGSIYTDLISCVIAVCPINICQQAIQKRKVIKLLAGSAWSYKGRAIPYAALKFDIIQILKDSLKARGVCLLSCYKEAVNKASEEASIKVEKIKGPILFLSAEHDGMWPASKAAELMMCRLKEKHFMYECEHISYEYASHFLIPYQLKSTKIFAVERKYPNQCMTSNLDSFEKTLAFLNAW